jgi:Protein of unknown function (DUF2934)
VNNDAGRKPVNAVRNEPSNVPANIDEAIRRRAYELYEERGRKDGHDLEDWWRAEAEIVQRKSRTIAA